MPFFKLGLIYKKPVFSLVVFLLSACPAYADALTESRALNARALDAYKNARFEEAEALSRQALPLCEDTGSFKVFCKGQFLELLGDIYFEKRRFEEALTYLQDSLKIRQEGLGPGHHVVGQSHLRMARVLMKLNRFDEAESNAKSSLTIFGVTAPSGSELQNSLDYLIKIYTPAGRCSEASPLATRYIALLERLYGADSPSTDYAKLMGVMIWNCNGELEAAEKTAHNIVVSFSKLPAENAYKWFLLQQLDEIAVKFIQLKKYTHADSVLQDALLIGEPPALSTPRARRDGINILSSMGVVKSAQGRLKESIVYQLQAFERGKNIYGPNDPNLAVLIVNLATSYQKDGRDKEAIQLAEQAIEILNKAKQINVTLGYALSTLGRAQQRLGEYESAYRTFKKSQQVQNSALPENNIGHVVILIDLGNLESDMQRWSDAEANYTSAIELSERFHFEDTSPKSAALLGLGLLLRAKGEFKKAEALLQTSIEIEEKGHDPASLAKRLLALATVFRRENKLEEAEAILNRSLTLDQSAAHKASVLNSLGLILSATDRLSDAREAYNQAIQTRESEHISSNDPDSFDTFLNLADLEESSGHHRKAEELFRENLNQARKQPRKLIIAKQQQFLADALRQGGKLVEAETLAKEAIEICERELGPDNPYLRPYLRTLALIDLSSGKAQDAEQAIRRVLFLNEKDEKTPNAVWTNDTIQLATALRYQGNSKAASDAIESRLKLNTSGSLNTEENADADRQALENLAVVLPSNDDQTADKLFRQNFSEMTNKSNDRELAKAYRAFAAFLVNRGKYPEAIATYKRILTIDENISKSPNRSSVIDHLGLGKAYELYGDWNEALAEFNEARKQSQIIDDPLIEANVLTTLASFAVARDKIAEAVILSERAVEVATSTFGDEAPALLPYLCQLGTNYILSKRLADANRIEKYVNRLSKPSGPAPDWSFAVVSRFKASLLVSQGNIHDARQMFSSIAEYAGKTDNVQLSALTAYNIANLDLIERRFPQAIEHFKIVIQSFQKNYGPQSPLVAFAQLYLASAYEGAKEKQKAAEAKSNAMKIFRSSNITFEARPPRWL